ncbi:MAG: ATP-binding cassette domain-containing protein [Holophaga sp.]|nr:ATP-binding cassette domain-containing protein [Holophaga sp.]
MLNLCVKDLHKKFGALEVLKGVSLTAGAGDVISIIGSSGSGKSTLLRCINFLELPDAGTVSLNGEEIRMTTGRFGHRGPADHKQLLRLRTRLAMVFQHFNLWAHMTVLENVIEGPIHVLGLPREEALRRSRLYLDKVGLDGIEAKYPAHLSGGQQQRVAIARALAMEPDVLLFDEPTSALDPELVGEVLKVMQQLAGEGRTMIVVTHEMGFARDVSSHVIFLHNGHIEEEGAPDRLLDDSRSERLKQFLSTVRK